MIVGVSVFREHKRGAINKIGMTINGEDGRLRFWQMSGDEAREASEELMRAAIELLTLADMCERCEQ